MQMIALSRGAVIVVASFKTVYFLTKERNKIAINLKLCNSAGLYLPLKQELEIEISMREKITEWMNTMRGIKLPN